jgi:hypothetical protein
MPPPPRSLDAPALYGNSLRDKVQSALGKLKKA